MSSSPDATHPSTARPSGPLRGRLRPPGDKSMSHRAFILGLLSRGQTRVTGPLEGDDVPRTGEAATIVPGSDVIVENVMMNPLRTGLVTALREMGARIEELDRRHEGAAGQIRGGGTVETHLDHRIAMRFPIMDLASRSAMTVDDDRMIATSYPAFVRDMAALGATLG